VLLKELGSLHSFPLPGNASPYQTREETDVKGFQYPVTTLLDAACKQRAPTPPMAIIPSSNRAAEILLQRGSELRKDQPTRVRTSMVGRVHIGVLLEYHQA
jgi:hypothetical protein